MYTKLVLLVLASVPLLFAAIDPDDSLYVRTLLDTNGLNEVEVSDVVNYDKENGRIFSLFLSNVYTIYGKKVTSLPDDIDRLDTLLYIMVNDAALETLPDAIGNLPHLKQIEAQRNRLKRLPETIGDCPKLEYINIADNELETLPAGIARSTSLYVLNVANNLLSSLPDEITAQTFNGNYSGVNFNGNLLCGLTGSVGEWFSEHFSGSLQHCNPDDEDMSIVARILEENGLSDVTPDMVTKLHEGRVINLDFSSRNISTLPPQVGQLELLEELILENNSLTDLPSTLADLAFLTTINLSRNQFSEVPPVVLSCAKLEMLHMEHNELTSLPAELMFVPRITCRFNRLCNLDATLAWWLEEMDGSVYLHTQDCPIPDEGHPMLATGNSWNYTIIQESSSTDEVDSLVREIVISGISPDRDTVFTIEHDSGMVYSSNGGTFVTVDTSVERNYLFSYQRLVPVDRNETYMEDLPLLINSDWNPEEPGYQVDTFKVFAEEKYFYDEDSAGEMEHLCLSGSVGLLGGELQASNGVQYQVYLHSFNETVFASDDFRQQVNTVSGMTPVRYVAPDRRRPPALFTGHAVQRFDLLGRKVEPPVVSRGGMTGYGVCIETDHGNSRFVVRLR